MVRVAIPDEDACGGTSAVDVPGRSALVALRPDGGFNALLGHVAQPFELSAAPWRVVDAVRAVPQSVSGVARLTGTTRQSVRRLADLLVARSLAVHRVHPADQQAGLPAVIEPGGGGSDVRDRVPVTPSRFGR
ncbi:MarR family transcriptional regulator [Streptomyces sp. URMC 126]|uniref:MarR family transcriptional regulator n=1 Tax=Streptomyces sp. URMC 126 TaxID=3423401 RepID=UPI003F19F826